MTPFASPTPWNAGTVLDGRWEVEHTPGRGPMSVVLAVHDRLLDRACALKLCAPEPDARERLSREARMLAGLRSPHVVRALGAGALADGTPYLAMERLHGRDLQVELRARGPMSVLETANTLLAVSDALGEAHALGMVHRDLKPANVFRCADGTIKLLDFGVGKGLGDRTITARNTFVGTMPYLSPEQIMGRACDSRSDIWSLGVLGFRPLTGALPFGGSKEMLETAQAILNAAPRSLRVLAPDTPTTLVLAIERCLRKAPEHRFQNVATFAEVVRHVVRPRSMTITPR